MAIAAFWSYALLNLKFRQMNEAPLFLKSDPVTIRPYQFDLLFHE